MNAPSEKFLWFALGADEVDQNLLRLFSERLRAFVAHLGELFDGALLDLFIVGFEQFLPDLEKVDARVNFLDELRGILGQRFFAGRVRFPSATLIGLFRIFAWDARPLLGTLKSSRRAPLLQIR